MKVNNVGTKNQPVFTARLGLSNDASAQAWEKVMSVTHRFAKITREHHYFFEPIEKEGVIDAFAITPIIAKGGIDYVFEEQRTIYRITKPIYVASNTFLSELVSRFNEVRMVHEAAQKQAPKGYTRCGFHTLLTQRNK